MRGDAVTQALIIVAAAAFAAAISWLLRGSRAHITLAPLARNIQKE